MDRKHSTITFCREDYRENGEVNEYAMFSDICEFIRIAIRNGYQMRVCFDGMTVIVEFNLQNAGLSGVTLEWVGDDEYVVKEGEHNEEPED